jgi:acetyl esterase
MRRPALVEPASAHPSLDPTVRSFVDRWEEGVPDLLSAEEGTPPASPLEPGWMVLRPARYAAPLPLLLYLEVASDETEDRGPALQALADRAGVAVLQHSISPQADRRLIQTAVRKVLERLAAAEDLDLDAGLVAIGGDGLGAVEALALAANPSVAIWPFRLLVMATPVLGAPSATPGTAWLPESRAIKLAEAAMRVSDPAGLPTHGLPPVLMLTAEADPFRERAEALARRFMAEGLEVSAIRVLGTIHDFTWLPPLRDAPGSIGACRLMADALRQRLRQNPEEEFPS